MHFALISPPGGSRECVGGLSRSHYPTKIPMRVSRRKGRSREYSLEFRLNPVLSQNHQVHTHEGGNPGTSPFYPSRDNPDLLSSFLPLPQSLLVPGVIFGVANPADRSSTLLSRRSLAFFSLFRSSTQFQPLEQGSAHFQFRPRFEPTTLNSMTLGPIFSLFLDSTQLPRPSQGFQVKA